MARQTAEGSPRCRRVAAAAALLLLQRLGGNFSSLGCLVPETFVLWPPLASGAHDYTHMHTRTHIHSTFPHPLSLSLWHAPCIFLRSPQVAYFRFLHALLAPHWAGSVSTYAHARESLSRSCSLSLSFSLCGMQPKVAQKQSERSLAGRGTRCLQQSAKCRWQQQETQN